LPVKGSRKCGGLFPRFAGILPVGFTREGRVVLNGHGSVRDGLAIDDDLEFPPWYEEPRWGFQICAVRREIANEGMMKSEDRSAV
jgi:hypothetical protein